MVGLRNWLYCVKFFMEVWLVSVLIGSILSCWSMLVAFYCKSMLVVFYRGHAILQTTIYAVWRHVDILLAWSNSLVGLFWLVMGMFPWSIALAGLFWIGAFMCAELASGSNLIFISDRRVNSPYFRVSISFWSSGRKGRIWLGLISSMGLVWHLVHNWP